MKLHHEYDAGQDCNIGRDPRTLSVTELEEMGRPRISRTDAIRQNCLACANSAAEVRRCSMIECPLWVFRMGSDPYAAPRAPMSAERREAARQRLNAVRPTKSSKAAA